MIFDYNVIWASMPLYLSGMLETVKLLGISLFFGLLAILMLLFWIPGCIIAHFLIKSLHKG